MAQFTRTSQQLYRDCLRLATRLGGRSAKGIALRTMVKAEFVKNKSETDELKIIETAMKNNTTISLKNNNQTLLI